MTVFIGCAGWNLPKASSTEFPDEGTHLQRYAARFNCVEINSSFYRPHRPQTYARWAASTPADFRFAVKVPKQITHTNRLIGVEVHVDQFLEEANALGEKRGPLLVQLPPSLAFDRPVASQFFMNLRNRTSAPIVCEPRHASWFTLEAESMLSEAQVARVAADPCPVQRAGTPGGSRELRYFRWHGSPRIYYSAYGPQRLAELQDLIENTRTEGRDSWCIFDNTAAGAATTDALALSDQFALRPGHRTA